MTGRITANTKREALDAIHRLKLFPLSVEDSQKGDIKIELFQRRVPDIQISATLLQLADLLENGVPVLQAFQILEKQTPNPRLKSIVKNIHDRISEGESVDSAFAAHSNVFDELTVSIIRAGAEGAFLEDSLRRVGGFLEQQVELRGKVIGAMIYPMVILSLGLAFIVGALVFIVPQFQEMFDMVEAMGQTLPFATLSLFWMRDGIINYWYYLLGFGVFLFIWIQGQLATAWGIRIWDRLKMRIPVLGEIILNGAVARFCRVFGTLLANGVPILKSLEISSQSTGNSILSDAVKRSAENVSSGDTLSKPLAEAGIIPPQVMAMISVAEESNTLETVLVNTANSLERQSSRQLDILVRTLEPAMLLLVGGAIFYIIMALVYPMLTMDMDMSGYDRN